MGNQIDQIVQTTRRYWFDDGFVEISWGALLGVGASLVAAQELVPHSSLWLPITLVAFPLLIFAVSIAIRAFVIALKEQVTFPRTGYVSLHNNAGRSILLMLVVSVTIGIMIAILTQLLNHEAIIAGLALAAAFTSLGFRFGVQRFYALGILAMLLGITVSLPLNVSESLGIVVLLGGTGVGMLVSGLLVLRRYLNQHPHSPEISHD